MRLNGILWQFFGIVSFLLPFVFLLTAAFLSKIKSPLRDPHLLIGGLTAFISLLGIFKAGVLGIFLWEKSALWITDFGAFLIFFTLFWLGVVILFNTSLSQIAENISRLFKLAKKYTLGERKRTKKSSLFVGDEKKPTEIDEEKPLSEQIRPPISPMPATTLPQTQPPIRPAVWLYPPLTLLQDDVDSEADRGDVKGNAGIIEKTLESFGITARVKEVNSGPAVTQYALEVALGTKLSKITALSNDLALALAASTGLIRIEAPIPGRSLVGIEVPNKLSATVSLKQMLSSSALRKAHSKLAVPLGLDVAGEPKIADLTKMPHVLVAGQTGAGKSVLLNSWIATLLFRTTPEEVKLVLVDPKRVELTRYNDIPHLLTPVIVEPEKVVSTLKWTINEMDRRYRSFSDKGARNLDIYNEMVSKEERLPYLVIIIDELADIMLVAPAEIEDKICRIAQLARATGIHLVLATQRPSVDVLTGLIKANIPCRISFAVTSMTDSRVILDTPGAEKLLGRGDMLYTPPDQAKPTRLQGAFISDNEVNNLINFLKQQGQAEYREEVLEQPVAVSPGVVMVNGQTKDALFDDAAEIVRMAKKASSSLLQRKLKIGYARAARILDELEAAGIVSPGDGAKPRTIIGIKEQ